MLIQNDTYLLTKVIDTLKSSTKVDRETPVHKNEFRDSFKWGMHNST